MPPTKVQRNFLNDNWPRIEAVENMCVGYGPSISSHRISYFLTKNFKEEHMDLILRLLENIDYYDNNRTVQLVNQLGEIIKGNTNQNFDDVIFIPIEDSTGTSSDWIIKKFRNQMGLGGHEHADKFPRNYNLGQLTTNTTAVDISNLETRKKAINNLPNEEANNEENLVNLEEIDQKIAKLQQSNDVLPKTIIFVDEFIGSGTTVLEFLTNAGSWYSDDHDYYVATLCSHEKGIQKIQNYHIELDTITVMNELPDSAKLFHPTNDLFSIGEIGILKKYTHEAASKTIYHYGYKNTQSNIIFYERASNNILPILYSEENNWYPLFKR